MGREEKFKRTSVLDGGREKRRSCIRIIGKNTNVLIKQSIINLVGQEVSITCKVKL